MKRKELNNSYIEYAVVMIVLVFCEWFFFRNVIGTSNGALIGDRGDGRLTTLLTEHWWNFFNGKESFSEIAMFYPVEEVFGYTDLFLGYGLIFSVFRFMGIHMFISYKWTLIVVHVMGTVTMYYLMNKKLHCNVWWSLFGTIAFCFSDTFARHLGHTQLDAVSALPLLLILFLGFIDNYENRKKRNVYAYALIAWFVLLTYNSWYIACFTGVFCLVFIFVYFIDLKIDGVRVVSYFKEKILFIGKDIIGYILFMAVLYVPFIKIYLPVLQASSGYSYDTCIGFLPELADIINVSESNFMLGSFIEKIGLSDRGYSGEVEEGFSIILLGLFLVMFAIHNKKHVISDTCNLDDDIAAKEVPGAIFVSVLVSITLIIRLSSNGVSLWAIVYHVLPVVKSMRAVARFLLWLSFPMAVITAYTANKYLETKGHTKGIIISFIVIVFLFVSNINNVGVDQRWNYQDEYSFITSVSAPPEDAEIFYIIDTAATGDAAYIYQLDAYEIATWYSLKTINGYSGQLPPDWGGIWDICSENYENNIFAWIEKYSLTNVYAYDRATNTWIPSAERITLSMDDVFFPADNKFSSSAGLEDWNLGSFAWTGQNFKTQIINTAIKDTGLVIKMQLCLSNYMAQNANLDPYLQIWVDGEMVQDVEVTDEYVELNIPMSDHNSDIYNIEMRTNCYFNPKDIGMNEDTRNLSIGLYYMGN